MNRTMSGVGLALATAAISGVAVFLNGYAVREVTDPAVFTTLKNGVAALVLLVLAGTAVATRRPHTGQRLGRRSWLGLVVVGIVGGSVPFLLFFTGLATASAPAAALIHKTLFVWVALLAVPLLGERLGWIQIGAMAVLVASQLLITAPTGLSWGSGETMIAAATLLWSVEVIVARRLLREIDPLVLGVGRLGIGLVFLVGYLALVGKLGMVIQLTAMQWTWVFVTGFVLAGYVGTWLSALKRAPATVVTSVLGLAVPITVFIDGVAKGPAPAPAPLAAYVLMVAATLAIIAVTLRPGRRAALDTVPA
jgi:drug/metabolite transporter (DMT)-like permease